jgi:ABC-2 type transport system permease protein
LPIWVLFARFGAVDGWRFGDVAMFFGLISISFAIADFLSRGFDVLGTEFIKTGNFDRILLRPRTATLSADGPQLSVQSRRPPRPGARRHRDCHTEPRFSLDRVGDRARAMDDCGGVALFVGLMVIQGALSFWTTESLEVMNL